MAKKKATNPETTKVEAKKTVTPNKTAAELADPTAKMLTPKKIKLPSSSFIENSRVLLQYYYLDGGDTTHHATFSGTIYSIDKKKGYCISSLHIYFVDKYGERHSGTENHVWIYGAYMAPLKSAGVEVGDTISFEALAYAYKRNNGTIDFSLLNLSKVKIKSKCADTYKSRVKDADKKPELCKCCIFVGKCNQQCIAPMAYKRELAKAMAMRKRLWPDTPIVV